MIRGGHILKLSFYNFDIQLRCDDHHTLDHIRRDFSFFVRDDALPEVFFEIFPEDPDYSKLPSLKAALYTPRNICYRNKHLSFIDYFGKGLTIIDAKENTYKIYCRQPHLRHEITYLTILSLVGQNFDARNIHRVHSLGVEIDNKTALILLPRGGGKTSLFLHLLRSPHIKLISEDR